MEKVREHTTYSALAHVYDAVMDDINYEVWGDFIDEIMQTHHPDPHRILELGCGTGSLTLSLDELMCYDITGTDKSSEMIKIAREKAGKTMMSNASFKVMDFLDLSSLPNNFFDVVLLTFDSINYLHREGEILTLLNQVKKVLKQNGIFIFDFTTPLNSEQAIEILDGEEGYHGNYYYHRHSQYDAYNRIHTNIFTIRHLDKDHQEVIDEFREVHEQRIYTLEEMQSIIGNSDFNILSKYEGFDLVDADEESLRITLTLQCPQNP